jgi:LuxR family maltose regulon positive regulatory protein
VRGFLLQTSILDRLSGPLCDAVTGQQDGKAMLESLDRANLFLVALDDRRRWYRYHHLFADVLHTHLLDEQADRVADLHRRASRWYERSSEPSQAIRHALAAGDVERAAGIVELAIPALRRGRQEASLRGFIDAIPDDVVRVRPVLAVGFIGALMAVGEFEGVEERLRDAERWLEPADGLQESWTRPVGMVVVDEAELPRLPAAIEMYRAALALVRGDAAATIGHGRRAIDRAAEDDHLVRAGASALMGLALWSGGDLEAAHRAYSVAVEGLQRAGHIADVLGCSITLADIRATQGRPGEALRTYERALRLASGPDGAVLRGTADMHVGMSQIACERDDLAAATRHLLRARELGEHTWLPQNPYRWRVAMARVREAEGDLDGAIDLLDEALRVYVGDYSPNVRPVPALRARLLAAQGRVAEAMAWAREQGLSAEDELSWERDDRHVSRPRARRWPVRDPARGASRPPLGGPVRRDDPHQPQRRHHRHRRPRRRPGGTARTPPHAARPRPPAALGHAGRTSTHRKKGAPPWTRIGEPRGSPATLHRRLRHLDPSSALPLPPGAGRRRVRPRRRRGGGRGLRRAPRGPPHHRERRHRRRAVPGPQAPARGAQPRLRHRPPGRVHLHRHRRRQPAGGARRSAGRAGAKRHD